MWSNCQRCVFFFLTLFSFLFTFRFAKRSYFWLVILLFLSLSYVLCLYISTYKIARKIVRKKQQKQNRNYDDVSTINVSEKLMTRSWNVYFHFLSNIHWFTRVSFYYTPTRAKVSATRKFKTCWLCRFGLPKFEHSDSICFICPFVNNFDCYYAIEIKNRCCWWIR